MSTATATRPDPSAQEPTRRYPSYSRPLWRRALLTREVAVIALLAVVYGWSYVNVENFDGPLTLYYLFLDISPVLLIALPMTLVIMTGEIDLSVASVMGLSSALLGLLHHDAGLSVPTAALIAVLVGAVCGSLNGFLVAYVGLPSLAVTIGTLALYRGIAQGLLGTTAITDFPERWTDLAKQRIVDESSYPLVLVPLAVLVLLFVWLLHFSTFGRGVVEIGLDDEAAHFSGVRVARTKLVLFVLSGAISAAGGIFYTLYYTSARGDNATGFELQVIAAVLLGGVSIFGGRGALHGVVAGVLLIGVLQSAMRLEGYTVNVINIVVGVLLVLSVISTSVLSWVSAFISGRRRAGRVAPAPDGAGKRSQSQSNPTERHER